MTYTILNVSPPAYILHYNTFSTYNTVFQYIKYYY